MVAAVANLARSRRLLAVVASVAVAWAWAAAPGDRLPAFSVVVDGGGVVRSEDLVGQPLLVGFWAPWCPPCRDELPLFGDLADAAGASLRIVLIGIDAGPGDGRAWVGAAGETLTFARSPTPAERRTLPPDGRIDSVRAVQRRFGVFGLPETWLVDAEGRVVRIHRGPLDAAGLGRLVGLVGVSWP